MQRSWSREDLEKHLEYLRKENRYFEKRFLEMRQIENERDSLRQKVKKLEAQVAANRKHSPLVVSQKPKVPCDLRRTSYRWQPGKGADGWRIGYGPSNFLVAYGSGWSRPLGKAFFLFLVARSLPAKAKKKEA